jgi:drug/metabolite transporter (DMT)-like permease
VIRLNLRKPALKYLILTGILEPGIYSVFEIYGLSNTSASVSSIFIATIPCATLVAGAIFWRIRLSRMSVISILMAFAGVVVFTVFSPAFQIGGNMSGYLYMTVAVLAGAFYAFASQGASKEYGPMEITAMMAFTGAILFNIICIIRGHGIDTYAACLGNGKLLTSILFLGVCCSSLCYLAFNKILAEIDAAIANNLVGSMTTVVGVAAGIMLNGDPSGWFTVIGMGLTVTGVWLSSRDVAMGEET